MRYRTLNCAYWRSHLQGYEAEYFRLPSGNSGEWAATRVAEFSDDTLSSTKAGTSQAERDRCSLCRWRGRSHRCSRGNRRHGSPVVHQILQFLTGLEKWDLLGWNLDALSRLGIAPHPGLALASAKTAKAADFDLIAGAQRAHHAVKDRLHNHFAVFPRKFSQTRDFVNQIGFGHNIPFYRCCGLQVKAVYSANAIEKAGVAPGHPS